MKKRYLISPLVAAVLLLPGCSREAKVDAKADGALPVTIEEAPDVSVITVERSEQFPLVKVESRKGREELKVNGSVAPDVNRTVPVNALSGGRVTDIRTRLGDEVVKGQVLLRIHSPDLSAAFSDYQKFRADELLARRQFERARLLYSHGAIAQKEVQMAEYTHEKAKVDVQTAAERIRILGGDLNHPSPVFDVKAPISGTIVEQNTAGGAGVKSLDNAPNLFTVADLSRVWVLCDVYENNLSRVHCGDYADVRLNAYPDRVLKGRITNISRVLDPATRTAKVRLELDNRGSLLRPGMFATVTFYSQSTQSRAVVPASAVLRLHDKDWVFRPEGQGRFRRIEIQTLPATGDGFQQVTSGLKAGDEVVSNALELSSSSGQS